MVLRSPQERIPLSPPPSIRTSAQASSASLFSLEGFSQSKLGAFCYRSGSKGNQFSLPLSIFFFPSLSPFLHFFSFRVYTRQYVCKPAPHLAFGWLPSVPNSTQDGPALPSWSSIPSGSH